MIVWLTPRGIIELTDVRNFYSNGMVESLADYMAEALFGMAKPIKERIERAEDGTLMLRVTPEEWMFLAERIPEVPIFYTGSSADDEEDRAFSFNGIIVYCNELRALKALIEHKAINYLESLLCGQATNS